MQNKSHRQGAIHLFIVSTEKKIIIFTETDTDVMERIHFRYPHRIKCSKQKGSQTLLYLQILISHPRKRLIIFSLAHDKK